MLGLSSRHQFIEQLPTPTSPGVRCSRGRPSPYGRLVGATVRKTSVGATGFNADLSNGILAPENQTVRTSYIFRKVRVRTDLTAKVVCPRSPNPNSVSSNDRSLSHPIEQREDRRRPPNLLA